MGALSKRYLRGKLAGHPFLYLLVQDVWFRFGLIGFLALPVFLGLVLPRIWTTSPPGFRPIVKVSGLDLAQAWSLKRTALKAVASGRFDEANYAWVAALANNRADTDLIRGTLRSFLASEDPQKYRKLAVPQALWLLRLTGTNVADLALAAKVFAQYRRSDLVIENLEPRKAELPPVLEGAYLKALFQAGKIDVFSNRWAQVQAKVSGDAELTLRHAALVAALGPMETARAALESLETALEKPAQRPLACRLLLLVSARRFNTERYRELLGHLREMQGDTLLDHIGYWRLLARSGRKDEALRLAELLSSQPASAAEVLALAHLYREWMLGEGSLRVLRRFVPEFAESPELWLDYADTLVEDRGWDELRRVALQIRVQADGGQDALTPYSYYLEGRAELGSQRLFHAKAAFQKVTEREFQFPKLGLSVGNDLLRLGYAELCLEVLLKLEHRLALDAEYWPILFQAAERLKQSDLMLRAARQAHQLRPGDAANAQNLAAALLIQRQSPEEAVQLTFRATSRHPHSVPARINHAAALLLNGRTEEASALLKSIDAEKLPRAQRTLYHLNRFEAALKLQRHEEARVIRDAIDPRLLYPPQARWFEHAQMQLPPRDELELADR